MKRIIAAGCSFTQGDGTYVEYLQNKGIDVVNAGSAAAGNAYIARAFLHHAYQDRNIIGICQWSGIHRQGFLTDDSAVIHHLKKISQAGVARGDYYDENNSHNKDLVWIKTGGNRLDAGNNSKLVYKKFVAPYIRYFYNKEQCLVETAEAILRVYHYCELHKIRCYMMWWKPELIHYKLGKYSKPLWDMIVDNKYITWLPSIGGWCVENAELDPEYLGTGGHPNPEHQLAYTESVLIPNVCQQNT